MANNAIRIRLLSVEFPDGRNADVTFQLFSDGHTVGEPYRELANITRQVPRSTDEHGRGLDYKEMVKNAAGSIASDFEHITDTLKATYT